VKSLKTSWLQRSPKLLSATVKILAGKDLESVLENISELKGVPQKLGQLMSMDVTQYVSAELKEKLKPLQGESKEMSSEIMFAVVEKELGSKKFNHFTHLNLNSIGAGSIGQVHRANINSKEVVLKIQYPDIEKSIATDLSILNPVSAVFGLIRPQAKDFSILLEETKNMLMKELDYKLEKENLIYFHEKLKSDPRFIVPGIHEEYCSSKVICMDYLEGMPLSDFIKSEASPEKKKEVAVALIDLFLMEFLIWGKVQTDPNFANYLITDDNRIVLLDFGAVKNFTGHFRTLYILFLNAAYNKNDPAILDFGEQLGLVHSDDKKEAISLFAQFMKELLSYFHAENNPVDFKNEEMTKSLLTTGWKLFKKQRISSPHSDMVFLHRKLGGLFSLLKEMQVEIDLTPLWLEIKKERMP
jgi:aarF domain-containing kinase